MPERPVSYSYSLDSKSRFAGVVDSIPFDPDAFIKAMQDAIQLEASKSGKTPEELAKEQKAREEKAAEEAAQYENRLRHEKEEETKAVQYYETIKTSFSNASPDKKNKAKAILNEAGFTKFSDEGVPATVLKQIAELF